MRAVDPEKEIRELVSMFVLGGVRSFVWIKPRSTRATRQAKAASVRAVQQRTNVMRRRTLAAHEKAALLPEYVAFLCFQRLFVWSRADVEQQPHIGMRCRTWCICSLARAPRVANAST